MGSDPSFDAVLGGLGSNAVDALKVTLGDAWDALTPQERDDCMGLMLKLAKVRLYELAGYDVADQLKTLKVAFEQWEVVGKSIAVQAMKDAASQAFGLGGAFAGGLLASFLKSGAIP